MQNFSNPVIGTNERIIIWVLGFEEEESFVFFRYHYFTIYGHDSQWSVTFEQTLNPISTVGSTRDLVEVGQLISEEKVFTKIMIL